MRLCVVSFKQCWQGPTGEWLSYGGFPAQMAALASLFDDLTLVVALAEARAGGIPLPPGAKVIALRNPAGAGFRRKMSVLRGLPTYLARITAAIRPADVVHAPVPGDLSFLGMVVATALGKRQFVMYNSSWIPDSQSTFMRWVTRGWMRFFAGGRNVMLALGPVGLTTVPAPGVHWIFVSIITEEELRTIRPEFDRPVPTPMRLAYVGRLSGEKGVPQLLQALESMRRDPGLTGRVPLLTLIGDGPQRWELEALVNSSADPNGVRFAGQLGRADLIRELHHTDVCVLPSLTEGFCKARLDAMLCGVPVVTTDVGFGREIVGPDGERGWVVPPYDVEALAEVLRYLVTEPIDWPAVRHRCHAYVGAQSVEAWSARIGEICAAQWGVSLEGGRLRS